MLLLLLITLGLQAPAAPAAGALTFEAVFLTEARLDTLRQRIARRQEPTYSAFEQLAREAQAALLRRPHVPEVWYVPGYYRDAEGHRRAKGSLQDDANSAYTLALYYRLTGSRPYARAARRLVNAWAGLADLRTEDDSRLSFSYHFPALIFAADLLDDAVWPDEERARFRRFVRERALPMSTLERENNWGNWGVVLTLAGAAYLEDEALFAEGVARWKELLGTQIAPDGHLPHEVGRNGGRGERGIWYSHFSIMPQTLAAEVARAAGVDLYDYRAPNGRTLREAFHRLTPWARDPSTFPYFEGDDPSEQAGTDYVSYFEVLNARWPDADAAAMLRARRPLTARHSAPHLTLTHGEPLR